MPNSLDERITQFEQHVDRQIRMAEHLAEQFQENRGPFSESGFFILAGMASYFETIWQFISGTDSRNRSKKFFVAGFREVYPTCALSDSEIGEICDWLRNGMYHSSMPKHDTHLSRHYSEAIRKDADGLDINPHELVRDIRCHFLGYMRRLRNSNETVLRAAFEKRVAELDRITRVRLATYPKCETSPNPMEAPRSGRSTR